MYLHYSAMIFSKKRPFGSYSTKRMLVVKFVINVFSCLYLPIENVFYTNLRPLSWYASDSFTPSFSFKTLVRMNGEDQ